MEKWVVSSPVTQNDGLHILLALHPNSKCLIITEMFIFLTNSLWCAYQRLIKPRGKKLSRSDLQIVNAPERPGILEL